MSRIDFQNVCKRYSPELPLTINNANITTVGQLAQKTEAEMLKYRNFGKKSLNEIKAKLEQLGLSLGQKIDERLLDKGVNS